MSASCLRCAPELSVTVRPHSRAEGREAANAGACGARLAPCWRAQPLSSDMAAAPSEAAAAAAEPSAPGAVAAVVSSCAAPSAAGSSRATACSASGAGSAGRSAS